MKKLIQMRTGKLLVLVKQCVILVFLLIFAGYYQCPIRKFLHIECPGCGMTRAVYALLRLEIKQAFQYYSLVWITFCKQVFEFLCPVKCCPRFPLEEYISSHLYEVEVHFF